jgi:hypothetical protein
LLQALVDAYLVCIGQLEAHLQAKDYLDTDLKEHLKEDVDIHIEDNAVHVTDDAGEEVVVLQVEPEEEVALDDEKIPPAKANIPAVVEPTEEPAGADEEPFEKPFVFDTPDPEWDMQEKPAVTDFFVDFDDPVGEPVTEKDLYGEEEEPIDHEKIDVDVEDKE